MAKSFRYTALNLQGEEEQGSLEADSREAAMSILARRDLTVSELEDQQADTTPRRGSPVSTYRLVTFAYELSSLLSAGLTLPQALGGAGFVDHVDRLVGQMAVVDEARGKFGRTGDGC